MKETGLWSSHAGAESSMQLSSDMHMGRVERWISERNLVSDPLQSLGSLMQAVFRSLDVLTDAQI